MRRIPATSALWVANAIVLFAAAFLFAFTVWRMLFGGSTILPEIAPLRVAPVALPTQGIESGSRNPFDPSGNHWQVDRSDGAQAQKQGSLKGFMVLPGLSLAITDNGVVKPGESIVGGKFKGINGDRIAVDTAVGIATIDGPGMNRPRLENINQAGKPVDRSTRSMRPGERK